jgi:large subunit ribosomal protein L31
MKQGIHPEYVESSVRCSCGNTFTTRATKPELRVELCSECHPFYTGKQKFVDTGGRVQRFSDKFGNAAAVVREKEAAEKAARVKAAEEAALAAKSAREAKEAEKADKADKAEKLDKAEKAARHETRADRFEAEAEAVAEAAAESDAPAAEETVVEAVAEAAAEAPAEESAE